jgi:prepilin peptidase CpaA
VSAPALAFCVLLALAIIAAATDLKSRRLPNWLTVATAVAGPTLGYWAIGNNLPWWSMPVHGALALLVCMGLYSMRWIGGGDAKFYAASATWIPLGGWALLVALVSVAGIVLLIAWFAVRLTGQSTSLPKNRPVGLPYGVAIGLGVVSTFSSYAL